MSRGASPGSSRSGECSAPNVSALAWLMGPPRKKVLGTCTLEARVSWEIGEGNGKDRDSPPAVIGSLTSLGTACTSLPLGLCSSSFHPQGSLASALPICITARQAVSSSPSTVLSNLSWSCCCAVCSHHCSEAPRSQVRPAHHQAPKPSVALLPSRCTISVC